MKADRNLKVDTPVTSPKYEFLGVVRSISRAEQLSHDSDVFDEVGDKDLLAVVEWANGVRTVERPDSLAKAACSLPFTFPWF